MARHLTQASPPPRTSLGHPFLDLKRMLIGGIVASMRLGAGSRYARPQAGRELILTCLLSRRPRSCSQTGWASIEADDWDALLKLNAAIRSAQRLRRGNSRNQVARDQKSIRQGTEAMLAGSAGKRLCSARCARPAWGHGFLGGSTGNAHDSTHRFG